MQELLQRARTLILFAIPISTTGLINILINFSAMIFIAQLGMVEIAAATLATSTYITFLVFSTSVLYSVSILISHLFSHHDNKTAENIGVFFKSSIWVSLILALPTAIFLWYGDILLLLFGQERSLVNLTSSYFHYAALSIFPTLVAMSISQFYIGIGKPRFGLVNALIRLPFAIFFSYVFILGQLGFPKMGIAGITCANFIVQTFHCIGIFIFMRHSKSLRKFLLFEQWLSFNWQILRQILMIGLPIGIQFGGELFVMTILTYLMGYFGPIPLAASQVVSQFGLLAIMMVVGMTQAQSVLISAAFRQKDLRQIDQYFQATQVVIFLFFLFISFIVYFFHERLLNVFFDISLPDNQLFRYYANIFFVISIITLYLDAIRNTLSGVLRGMHDSSTPMNVGLFCLWLIALPGACFLAFVWNLGAIGLQAGFISGFLVAIFLLLYQVRSKMSDLKNSSLKNILPSTVSLQEQAVL